jgi:hypothetical protein
VWYTGWNQPYLYVGILVIIITIIIIMIIIIIIIITVAVPGKHSIDSLQKTARLGTSHIIRKVLQCEA